MEERAFYNESQTTKPARLVCPYCRDEAEHQLKWLVRQKKDRLPGGADERADESRRQQQARDQSRHHAGIRDGVRKETFTEVGDREHDHRGSEDEQES